jgi:hypothetical protein
MEWKKENHKIIPASFLSADQIEYRPGERKIDCPKKRKTDSL